MEKKNAVYTIMEEQSPEEARREHILLIARNFAAGARLFCFWPRLRWRISTNCCAQRRIFSARARILPKFSS